jgi:hypothetical protein
MADGGSPKLFVWGASDVFASLASSLAFYDALRCQKDIVLFEALDPVKGHLFPDGASLAKLGDHVEWWLAALEAAPAPPPRRPTHAGVRAGAAAARAFAAA